MKPPPALRATSPGGGGSWAPMLRGALALGIMPEAFWRLSLREWRMLTVAEGRGAMGRGEFERLMEAYGDDRS